MIDTTKPVQTRDGRKARIISTDFTQDYPIEAEVECHVGGSSIYTYTAEGLHVKDVGEHGNDLVNVAPPVHPLQRYCDQLRKINEHHGVTMVETFSLQIFSDGSGRVRKPKSGNAFFHFGTLAELDALLFPAQCPTCKQNLPH